MLRQRVPSAIVIVLAAVVPAVLGHPILTIALIALAALGIAEFARAVRTSSVNVLTWPVIVLGTVLITLAGFEASLVWLVATIVLGSIGLFIALMLRGTIEGSTKDYAFSIGALAYVALPLAHMPLIRNHGDNETSGWLQSVNDLAITSAPAAGLGWLVLIVASTWMTDSAAYLGGRAFGKHKLAPTLSPKKTIEGAVAGALFGAFTGAVAAHLLGLPVPVYVGALLGLIISALGQAGDLAESLIKRDLGIKDMGNLIPGHGGILDRIDALLFTLPAGYYLVLVATEVNWP
jgi:phosphatidate cytidylyltransferase